MTKKQKRERRLGNAIRAGRGLFTYEAGTFKPNAKNQTTLAAARRITRAALRIPGLSVEETHNCQ